MTNAQLKEAKELKRQISNENYQLRRLEFDVEAGGHRSQYDRETPGEMEAMHQEDLSNIARLKQRIELLKQKFAAL